MPSIHGIPFSILLFFAVLVVVIFVLPVIRKKPADNRRAEALRAMGFAALPRAQVFEHPEVLARVIDDSPVASVSNEVAKGQSKMGETAIFDLDRGSASTTYGGTNFTIIAFRASGNLPDFLIQPVLPAERALHVANDVDIGMPESLAKYDRHAHKWIHPDVNLPVLKRVAIEGDPAFANDFYVWSSDAQAIRRALTSTMMSALVNLNHGNLHLIKRLGWLLVYRETSSLTPPERYPAMLQEAVELVQNFELNPEPAVGQVLPQV